MAAIRHAEVTWSGDLQSGSGTINYVSSGVVSRLPVSWAARTEDHGGKTSPEELLAAAHASCFSMALSGKLGRAGTPATKLDVKAVVTFDRVGDAWTVVSSALTVKGVVPGATAESFAEAAEGAKDGCPISRALKGNVELSVDASLIEG
jgi:osmotically inducible protein OsmC